MRIRQALLSLPTFPDKAPEKVVEGACVLAQLLGARLTVQLLQLSEDRSTWPPVMGAYPVDVPEMVRELVVASQANAATAAECVTRQCADYGVALDLRRGFTTVYGSPAPLVDLARLHDLTILPVPEDDSFGRAAVQAVLFGSSRPLLALPSHRRRLTRLDRIVVAWDFSREAARALSDALPLLVRAREVRIVTVIGEKHIHTSATIADLEQFLAAHEVRHSLNQLTFQGGDIGSFLMDQAGEMNADMLVMGAYGHSRLQEMILGGATRTVLRDPALPVFFSH